MPDHDSELIQAAIGGDRLAMGRLLMRHDAQLRRKVHAWIPRELGPLLTVDEVLQETYAEAYRHISSFVPKGPESLYCWLAKIAERRFFNARRWLLAGKRDLRKQVGRPVGAGTSFVELAQVLAGHDATPSHHAARHEFERQLQVALAGIKDDYREALWMRYIEGRPVKEVAALMGRTDRAVHMLCSRGLRALREQLGSASGFLTRK